MQYDGEQELIILILIIVTLTSLDGYVNCWSFFMTLLQYFLTYFTSLELLVV